VPLKGPALSHCYRTSLVLWRWMPTPTQVLAGAKAIANFAEAPVAVLLPSPVLQGGGPQTLRVEVRGLMGKPAGATVSVSRLTLPAKKEEVDAYRGVALKGSKGAYEGALEGGFCGGGGGGGLLWACVWLAWHFGGGEKGSSLSHTGGMATMWGLHALTCSDPRHALMRARAVPPPSAPPLHTHQPSWSCRRASTRSRCLSAWRAARPPRSRGP
jgi:hypothetical protein